jgi:hypothetical protein
LYLEENSPFKIMSFSAEHEGDCSAYTSVTEQALSINTAAVTLADSVSVEISPSTAASFAPETTYRGKATSDILPTTHQKPITQTLQPKKDGHTTCKFCLKIKFRLNH